MPWTDETIDPALLARIHHNYVEQFRLLARLATHGRLLERDGATLIATGYRRDTLNPMLVLTPPSDPLGLIADARAFYADLGVPWVLRVCSEAADRFSGIAVRARLLPGHPFPAMLLDPLHGEPAAVPGLAIRPVQDLDALAGFRTTVQLGFDMTADVAEVLTPAAVLHAPDVALYLGYVDGRPVATATRVTTHRIAGVYNVSTLPAYRGRGIGEAMTWRAALDGREEGCLAAALQATDMGFPIYQRMGFRHVADYGSWRPV